MKLESGSKSLVQVERKTVKILSQAKMEDKSGDPTRRLTRWNKKESRDPESSAERENRRKLPLQRPKGNERYGGTKRVGDCDESGGEV
jgi:hypothetical protein